MKEDLINHPSHYTSHPSGIECIEVVEHMPFNVGNAIKYLWRAGLKGSLIEDLKKARWYIDREIQRLEVPSCEGCKHLPANLQKTHIHT
jgi:uncharacterized protein DUF3310